MRVEKGKIKINKNDLKRKVVVIRNHATDVELQSAQFAAMEAIQGCLAIPESSFKKYNDFRYENKMERLPIDRVLVIDVRIAEQQENFEKFNNKKLKE